jgi:hypothetical protein
MAFMTDAAPDLATLEKKVDIGFARVDERMDRFEATMKDGFDRIDDRFDRMDAKMDARFDAMDAKFDRKFDNLYRLAVSVGGGMIGTLVAGIVAILIAHM